MASLLPLALLLLASSAPSAPSAYSAPGARQTPGPETVFVRGTPAAAGEALVRFRPGRTRAERRAVHDLVGAREVRDLRYGIAHVAFDGMSVEEALARYAAQPEILVAEPNAIRELLFDPDDPLFDTQWGLEQIHAPPAWDIQSGDPSVVLAVFDTGMDLAHPDLPAPVFQTDLLDNDAIAQDTLGHGTAVTGIASASTDNGIGVAGTAHGCSLAAYRVATLAGATAADTMAALNDVVDRGFHVVNMSYGSGFSVSTEATLVAQVAALGVVMVAASGNTGTAVPRFPAAYAHVIGVANSNQSDEKAASSTFGQWSSVAAPGQSIRSTNLGGGYQNISGTSASSPFVAGVAALLYSQLGGERTPANGALVRSLLESTAVPVPGDYVVNGRVDALLALYGLAPPAPPTIASVAPSTTPAFFGDPITIHGTSLFSTQSVEVGAATLGTADLAIEDDTLSFSLPPPSTLGTVPVTVTTAGGSAAATLDLVATDPPQLSTPDLGIAGQTWTARWAAEPGQVFLLLYSEQSATFPYFGVDVLGPSVFVGPSGALSDVGYADLSVPSPALFFASFFFQTVLFDPGTFAFSGATNIDSTFFF